MNPYSVTFQSNDLSSFDGIELFNHEFNLLPIRDIKINKVARRDLSIITSSEYSSKEIRVFFDVCGGSRAGTEDLLTFLKSLVQPQNGLLVVSQGGEDVEYTATMNEFNYSWLGITAITEIVFIASDPIGRSQEAQVMTSIIGVTDPTTSSTFTTEGSTIAYPIITVTVNTVTGGTAQQITISNGQTNQGITITRTWANGDILEINSFELEARVNGSVVDFTGLFPEFTPGLSQLAYTDSFTTRSVDITASYQPRYV